ASLPAHTKTHSFGRSLLQVGFPSSISPELPSRRAQRSHQIQQSRVRRLRPARDQIPQLVVREIEEAIERRHVFRRHLPSPRVEIPRKDQVVLQHAAPATPAQAIQLGRVHSMHYTARLTMISLILLIALVGLSPFGQTSTQFMIVWQRKRRYGSSRSSRRAPIASSRVSAMKRYAARSPAGPTNLSGFHQKDGHA